jgi:hypothetical protein
MVILIPRVSYYCFEGVDRMSTYIAGRVSSGLQSMVRNVRVGLDHELGREINSFNLSHLVNHILKISTVSIVHLGDKRDIGV